jgi:hypothetical protein
MVGWTYHAERIAGDAGGYSTGVRCCRDGAAK